MAGRQACGWLSRLRCRGADGRTSYVLTVSITGRTEQPWTVLNLEAFIRGPARYSQTCAVRDRQIE